MRVYISEVIKPMHDIRGKGYEQLHDPNDWTHSQNFGQAMKSINSWGVVYRSVRDTEGECIAALRPPAVSIPQQGPHLSYVWDGKTITKVYEKRLFK